MNVAFLSSRKGKMNFKLKESLSGNLKTPEVSFVKRTKTNHSCTYIRRDSFFLDTKSSYGIFYRRNYGRDLHC